jgi:hypothetical protein
MSQTTESVGKARAGGSNEKRRSGRWTACSLSDAANDGSWRTRSVASLPVLDAGFTSCPPTAAPHERIVRLIARDSVRHDVGPYSVKLPGYTRSPREVRHDSYAFIIQACRGDTLRIALINQLPVQGINLHEHGLITPPTPDIPGPAGDYVFLELLPGHIENYRVPIPADLPGAMFGKTTLPQPYPSGLYWFHAHRHMFARNQCRVARPASSRSGIRFEWIIEIRRARLFPNLFRPVRR